MRRYFTCLLIGVALCHCSIALAQGQIVALQVSDYHSQPIPATIISGKGPGTSTSQPTDIAGKTQIVIPSLLQPGDPLPLILVRAPNPQMKMMSPFEGRATIPRPPGFVEVILGVPGDPWLLRDKRVVWSLTSAIVQLNAVSNQREANLEQVALYAGYTPNELNQKIRSLASTDVDSSHQAVAAAYLREYGIQ